MKGVLGSPAELVATCNLAREARKDCQCQDLSKNYCSMMEVEVKADLAHHLMHGTFFKLQGGKPLHNDQVERLQHGVHGYFQIPKSQRV